MIKGGRAVVSTENPDRKGKATLKNLKFIKKV
jgi:hypothetical protein